MHETTIVFTHKMESVLKNILFGLKMTVKSGLEKFILKSLHPGNYEALIKVHQNYKFSNKNNHLPAWRDFKINVFRPLFTNMIFRPKRVFSILGCRFHFEGKNAVWITNILCVKYIPSYLGIQLARQLVSKYHLCSVSSWPF